MGPPPSRTSRRVEIDTLTFACVRSIYALFWVILVVSTSGIVSRAEDSCPSIEPGREAKLVSYVRKKYKVPESVSLSVLKSAQITGTCFRKLTFRGKTAFKEWDLTLYASGDARFLFSDLLDTQVDPVAEELRASQELMVGLAENRSASFGVESAPVTIVEFSDFACPYCKKFSLLSKQLMSEQPGEIRVVFHHMPLSVHPWARRAAEGAACAQLQGPEAFWAMHDLLFQRQEDLTAANLDTKLVDLATSTTKINLPTFTTCLTNEMSLGLVYKDLNLATANSVNATPTVFINGVRFMGFSDAAILKQAVKDAAQQSRRLVQ